MVGKKTKILSFSISFIFVSFLFLSNVYFTSSYKSLEIRNVYRIRFNDSDKLNFVLIPTGDFGKNDSQESTITIQFEEENLTIYQKYRNGTINLPHQSTKRTIDGTGTPWLNISLHTLDLDASELITVESQVTRFRSKSNYLEDTVNVSKWLQPTKYVDSNHSTIIEKSKLLATPDQTTKTKLAKIVDFVKNHVVYNQSYAGSNNWVDNSTYYGEEYGKASDTLRIKQGVCSHYARLCVALSRANKIPSRLVYGYLTSYSELWNRFSFDLHAWVEYYDQSRWNFIEPRSIILENQPAQYIPLISGPMQEDSYYIESKYPDTYVLDYIWDDDTRVSEEVYYENHSTIDIVFLYNESLGRFVILILSLLFLIPVIVVVKR